MLEACSGSLAGIGLIATSAAMFGLVPPTCAWRAIGLVSAASGIAAIVVYFHPYYLIALIVDIAIVAAATAMEGTSRRLLGI